MSKSIKLNFTVGGKKANSILHRVEKALMDIMVGQINQQLRKLDGETISLEAAIDSCIGDRQKIREVHHFVSHAQRYEICKE